MHAPPSVNRFAHILFARVATSPRGEALVTFSPPRQGMMHFKARPLGELSAKLTERGENNKFYIFTPPPCHPERSRNPSETRIERCFIVRDLGGNITKPHYRSRFAPSLGSGSTAKISHREIFSAQDDTAGRENITFYCFLSLSVSSADSSPKGRALKCIILRHSGEN